MRNTIFADKLDAVLTPKGLRSADALTNRSNDLVLGAQRAARRKLSKNQPAGRPPSTAKPHRMGPRYLESQKPNPFLHHIYAGESAAELLAGIEAENAEEAKPAAPIEEPGSPATRGPHEAGPVLVPAQESIQEPATDGRGPQRQVFVGGVEDRGPQRQVLDGGVVEAPIEAPPEKPKIHEPGSPAVLEEAKAPDEELPQAPTITLPPNLAWLEKQTPFSSNLSAIVDSLRAARQRVIYTLGQHQTRAAEYKAQWDTEVHGAEAQRERLRSLDDTLSACALVAEQSAGLEPGLLMASSFRHKPSIVKDGRRTLQMPDKNDPTVLRLEDVRKFFKANRDTNWTAAEIIPELPAIKRKHAKIYLPSTLKVLCDKSELQRIGRGIYRSVGS